MKTRTLILVFFIMAVLIIIGSCAKEKPSYLFKECEIYGTWLNPDYDNDLVWRPNDYPKVIDPDDSWYTIRIYDRQ